MPFCDPGTDETTRLSGDGNDDDVPLAEYLIGTDWTAYNKSLKLNPLNILLDEFEELICRFEIEVIMHTLAADYYHNRSFWFTFFPLLVVTTGVSICGFVNTNGNNYDDSMVFDGNFTTTMMMQHNSDYYASNNINNDALLTVSQSNLSLIVGLLGVLSTALASLGKHLNYESKGDMHASAVSTLNSIIDSIRFERMELQKKERMTRMNTKDKECYEELFPDLELSQLRVSLDTHKAKFETMEKSCTVPIPNKIKCAFACLRELTKLMPRELKSQTYRRFANELFFEFQNKGFCCWCPCYPPSIDVKTKYAPEFKREIKARLKCKTYNGLGDISVSAIRFHTETGNGGARNMDVSNRSVTWWGDDTNGEGADVTQEREGKDRGADTVKPSSVV